MLFDEILPTDDNTYKIVNERIVEEREAVDVLVKAFPDVDNFCDLVDELVKFYDDLSNWENNLRGTFHYNLSELRAPSRGKTDEVTWLKQTEEKAEEITREALKESWEKRYPGTNVPRNLPDSKDVIYIILKQRFYDKFGSVGLENRFDLDKLWADVVTSNVNRQLPNMPEYADRRPMSDEELLRKYNARTIEITE